MKLLVGGIALFVFCAPHLRAQETPQLTVPSTKLAPPSPPPADFGQPLMKALHEAANGDRDQAMIDAERSLALAEQQLGPNDKTVGNIVSIIGQLHLASGEYDKARMSYARVLQIEGKPTDAKSVDLEVASELARAGSAAEFQENPNYVRATEFYQQALAIRVKLFGHDSVDIVGDVYNLANSWVFQEKFAEAEPLFTRAQTICAKDASCKTRFLPAVLDDQAGMFAKQHQYQKAEATYKHALDIAQKNSNDAMSADVLDAMAAFYTETKRPAEAEKMSAQSAKIRARMPKAT